MATNKEMMLHDRMTPVVELQASAADIDAVARAYKNGQLGGVHLPDGETLKVEIASDITGDMSETMDIAWGERLHSAPFITSLEKGEHDAIRIDGMGVKTEGAGAVRFGLYEVIRNEDGTTGTLRLVETLGTVTMETDGMARLDIDGGYYTELNEVAVLALADTAMLCGYKMGGMATPQPYFEDADYFADGAEISCVFGAEAPVWVCWYFDYAKVDYMTIDEFAKDYSNRMTAAEGRLDDLEANGTGGSGLPAVTKADNGKIVGVVNGGYGLITLASAEDMSF